MVVVRHRRPTRQQSERDFPAESRAHQLERSRRCPRDRPGRRLGLARHHRRPDGRSQPRNDSPGGFDLGSSSQRRRLVRFGEPRIYADSRVGPRRSQGQRNAEPRLQDLRVRRQEGRPLFRRLEWRPFRQLDLSGDRLELVLWLEPGQRSRRQGRRPRGAAPELGERARARREQSPLVPARQDRRRQRDLVSLSGLHRVGPGGVAQGLELHPRRGHGELRVQHARLVPGLDSSLARLPRSAQPDAIHGRVPGRTRFGGDKASGVLEPERPVDHASSRRDAEHALGTHALVDDGRLLRDHARRRPLHALVVRRVRRRR